MSQVEVEEKKIDIKVDGVKVLSITELYFFLPLDFDGTIADALEEMAKYHREKEGLSESSADNQIEAWLGAWGRFKKGSKKLTASWSLSEYNQTKNLFERLEP